VEKNHG